MARQKVGIGFEISGERLRAILKAIMPAEVPDDLQIVGVDVSPQTQIVGIYFAGWVDELDPDSPLRPVGEGAPVYAHRLTMRGNE
jgi:hypothetical protein